jgi:hypothetical protein
LAQRGDEGRGKLRKASGSRKQAVIRGSPNGATRLGNTQSSPSERIARWKRTGGSEPSQYPQEEKTRVIPSVAASERGRAQTCQVQARKRCLMGVEGRCLDGLRSVRGVRNHQSSRRSLERAAIAGESPVSERLCDSLAMFPSTTGHVEPRGNLGRP